MQTLYHIQIKNTDITDRLLTGSPENVMSEVISEYKESAQRIEENFDIQDKLLPALVDAHASLARRRELLDDLDESRQKCRCKGV